MRKSAKVPPLGVNTRCLFFDGQHVVVELGSCHVTVTPIEVAFAGYRVGEYIHQSAVPVLWEKR